MKKVTTLLRSADVWSGALFFALGCAGLALGWELQPGSAFQMGPGYFPRLISGALLAIGAVTLVKALRDHGEEIGEVPWRAVAIVLGALIAFGLIVTRYGLAPAALVIVMISGLAATDRRIGQLAIAAVLLTAFAVVVFIYGLGLTIPVFERD